MLCSNHQNTIYSFSVSMMLLKDILVDKLSTEQARFVCGVLDPVLGVDLPPLTPHNQGLLNQARPRIASYRNRFPAIRLHDSVVAMLKDSPADGRGNLTVGAAGSSAHDAGGDDSRFASTSSAAAAASTTTAVVSSARAEATSPTAPDGDNAATFLTVGDAPTNLTVDGGASTISTVTNPPAQRQQQQQQPAPPPPPQHQQQQAAAPKTANDWADDALHAFAASLAPHLQEFWLKLSDDEDPLFAQINDTLWQDVHVETSLNLAEPSSVVVVHMKKAAETLGMRYAERASLLAVAAADSLAASVWPAHILKAAMDRAKADRFADINLNQPITELTAGQAAIVNDKRFKETHVATNMQHVIPDSAKELEKLARARVETANRAYFYLASAIELKRGGADDKVFDTFGAAMLAQLARDTQEAARDRLRLVANKNVFQRASEPPEHVSRLPAIETMATALGLKSAEQFFARDRTQKRAFGSGEDSQAKQRRTTLAAQGAQAAVQSRRGAAQGGGGRGRGGGGRGGTGGGGGRGGGRGRGGRGRGDGVNDGSWTRSGSAAAGPAPASN